MCEPPAEGWPLFTGLLGPYSLETTGCLPPKDAQAKRRQPCVPCAPWADFHAGASSSCRTPSAPLHPNLLWSFSSWAWCPSKHVLGRTPQAVHEKNVAFFFWAQKMQINNSLHLHKPKTDPPWQACPPAASLGVLGGMRVGGGSWATGERLK